MPTRPAAGPPDTAPPDSLVGRAMAALRAKGLKPPRSDAGSAAWRAASVELLPDLVVVSGGPDPDTGADDPVPDGDACGKAALNRLVAAVATKAGTGGPAAGVRSLRVRAGVGTALARGILDAADRQDAAALPVLERYLNNLAIRHLDDADLFREVRATLSARPAEVRAARTFQLASALAEEYTAVLVAGLDADPLLNEKFYFVGTALSPSTGLRLSPTVVALEALGPDACGAVREYATDWLKADAAQGFQAAKHRNIHNEYKYRSDRLVEAIGRAK